MVIFDTAMYHSGCAAADPSGASGNGTDELLVSWPSCQSVCSIDAQLGVLTLSLRPAQSYLSAQYT